MDLPVIQWYPGHIAKSRRLLKEYLKVIDLVVEVADARIPVSSRFVGAKNLIGNKAAILALTKTDLADSKLTATWVKILGAVPVNACTGKGIAAVKHRMLELKRLLDEKLRSRGRLPRPVRAMIIGLPNVGKSSLINRLTGQKKAPVGNKPGVTRAPAWIRVVDNLELLDTPGLIAPRLDDRLLALKLAMLGIVPTEAYDPIEVAQAALAMLAKNFPEALDRYGGKTDLAAIAELRGDRRTGGQDLLRTAQAVLHDLRSGAAGHLSLDIPPVVTG